MANIIVRSGNDNPMLAQPALEPNRWLRSLLGWDPFREMAPVLRGGGEIELSPDFDVKETKTAFLMKADVPGVKPSDLDVSVAGNRVTISGKRESEREEKTDTYYACERSYGSFTRSFTLPEGADANAVNAELKDGVLTVSIGKKAESQPKKIEVKTAAAAKPH